jgi:hypothetical protein
MIDRLIDRSTDRSIDQYKIEKIDRSTKELIVTSLDFNPILIVYFEEKVYDFLKRIPFYLMNSWFEGYPILKLTNFGNLAKISQLQVLVTPWGI